MKNAGATLLSLMLCSCAIEGIGFDGRDLAYQNAASASREYVSLHRGERDASWYANWCSTIRPHFSHMSEESARIDRYCDAMQQQPENAAAIAHDLGSDLAESGKAAGAKRQAAWSALAAYSAAQQAQPQHTVTPYVVPTAPAIHCTSYTVGAQTYTNCN